jgi:hypothetical protein
LILANGCRCYAHDQVRSPHHGQVQDPASRATRYTVSQGGNDAKYSHVVCVDCRPLPQLRPSPGQSGAWVASHTPMCTAGRRINARTDPRPTGPRVRLSSAVNKGTSPMLASDHETTPWWPHDGVSPFWNSFTRSHS